jgi:hypothetical protein
MKRACLSLLLLARASLPAQTTESLEFEGPDNAPIYVIEGDFSHTYTTNGLTLAMDNWSILMNPSTGALSGGGDFRANGTINSVSIDWDGSLNTALNVKQAGSVVRANGKITINGGGTIGGLWTLDRLFLVYTLSNFTVDISSAQMTGFLSASGSAKYFGGLFSIPLRLPRTYFSLDLPDEDSDGQWDSAGDWTASIDATVNGKGKITGTGELSVLDENGEAFDVIPQKVTGQVRRGTVTLAATGNSRSTSRIKVNLTYLQANDATVSSRSSVTAYGQSRKF